MNASSAQTQIELGHLVLYVRDLQRSLRFYRDALGLAVTAELFNGRAAMLSGGRTHHELMLIAVGEAPGPLQGKRLGLYHFAWRLGDDIAGLRAARDRLNGMGIDIAGMADHTISQSLYLRDPDGNEVELYVDNPTVDWRTDSGWAATPVKPLHLD